ncbi:SixA phosphatase family protein [Acuticoccus mangrovi]|uniref:Histidine phosphatase family protein n=1 Tax=Acuticoccus mangrovi TaxID=2796142 RepID=A0A934MJE8_9HYPH|nr:histidine phosphatase family protein [Acuticoccus mangrovi]MBJ3778226.1 histidine phosphatase family protein [Acuticoccus mangrovi]
MRHLIIMRHAKAERGEHKLDFDRTLDQRGWQEADRVGKSLAEAGLAPDTVLCSASRRTRDTLAAVFPHIRGDCLVHLRRSLYEADVVDLRDAVRTVQGQCVLVIGHNPAVHTLAQALAGSHPEAVEMEHGFPTSTAAVFTMGFAIDTVKFERLVCP